MLQVDGWVLRQCCSGVVEVAGIDHDVAVLSLASHYVRARAHAGQALLVVAMRVAYAAPRARALGQSSAAREVDCSWQMAAFRLGQYLCDIDRSIEIHVKISRCALLVTIRMGQLPPKELTQESRWMQRGSLRYKNPVENPEALKSVSHEYCEFAEFNGANSLRNCSREGLMTRLRVRRTFARYGEKGKFRAAVARG
jgi:hypothetical protein